MPGASSPEEDDSKSATESAPQYKISSYDYKADEKVVENTFKEAKDFFGEQKDRDDKIENEEKSEHAATVIPSSSAEIDSFSWKVEYEKEREKSRKLEYELAKVRHQLETKRTFVRYVSHEIRTPLNTVAMGLKLLLHQQELDASCGSTPHEQSITDLQELIANTGLPNGGGGHSERSTRGGQLSQQSIEVVEDIQESCDIAINIVSDLLLYEKLEGGLLQLEKQQEPALSTVVEAVKLFAIQAKQASIDLQLTINGPDFNNDELEVPLVYLDIDKPKFSQVLRNLVSNAIKFSASYEPPKKIRYESKEDSDNSDDESIGEDKVVAVHVSVVNKKIIEKTGDDDLMSGSQDISSAESDEEIPVLRVVVTDAGPGISPENQKKLFNSIVQFDPNKLQGGDGSGLGLFISKGIVDLHNGTIGVYSDGEGLGSSFHIEIPIIPQDKRTGVLARASVSSQQLLNRGIRIRTGAGTKMAAISTDPYLVKSVALLKLGRKSLVETCLDLFSHPDTAAKFDNFAVKSDAPPVTFPRRSSGLKFRGDPSTLVNRRTSSSRRPKFDPAQGGIIEETGEGGDSPRPTFDPAQGCIIEETGDSPVKLSRTSFEGQRIDEGGEQEEWNADANDMLGELCSPAPPDANHARGGAVGLGVHQWENEQEITARAVAGSAVEELQQTSPAINEDLSIPSSSPVDRMMSSLDLLSPPYMMIDDHASLAEVPSTATIDLVPQRLRGYSDLGTYSSDFSKGGVLSGGHSGAAGSGGDGKVGGRGDENDSARHLRSNSVDSHAGSSAKTATTTAPSSSFSAPSSSSSSLILVVDDAASNRKMAVRLLKAKRICKVPDEAANGQQAVDMVRASLKPDSTKHYTAVLMDYSMPVMDGPTAAKALREAGYTGLIIGVTGHVRTEEVEGFRISGVDHVMDKPLNVDKLLALLREAAAQAQALALDAAKAAIAMQSQTQSQTTSPVKQPRAAPLPAIKEGEVLTPSNMTHRSSLGSETSDLAKKIKKPSLDTNAIAANGGAGAGGYSPLASESSVDDLYSRKSSAAASQVLVGVGAVVPSAMGAWAKGSAASLSTVASAADVGLNKTAENRSVEKIVFSPSNSNPCPLCGHCGTCSGRGSVSAPGSVPGSLPYMLDSSAANDFSHGDFAPPTTGRTVAENVELQSPGSLSPRSKSNFKDNKVAPHPPQQRPHDDLKNNDASSPNTTPHGQIKKTSSLSKLFSCCMQSSGHVVPQTRDGDIAVVTGDVRQQQPPAAPITNSRSGSAKNIDGGGGGGGGGGGSAPSARIAAVLDYKGDWFSARDLINSMQSSLRISNSTSEMPLLNRVNSRWRGNSELGQQS